MSLILSGSDGVSDIDGTVSTPAIRGTDSNTGIFFPAADTIAFSEGGVESMRIDSSGNVGIGTTSSGNKFEVAGSGMFSGAVTTNTTGTHISYQSSNSQIGAWGPDTSTNGTLVFYSARSNGSNGLERMRVTSDGDLLVNGTTVYGKQTNFHNSSYVYASVSVSNNADHIIFKSDATTVGSVNRVGGTGVIYNTTSDYRLKENIAPITGALDTVAQLKPCTYTWKLDGSNGQGFIAHELQTIIPDAVSGEKDAVDENGDIKPQGIDQSRIVATLTAAIQELKAELDATKAEVQELKGVA
jgi:hypothetical protein